MNLESNEEEVRLSAVERSIIKMQAARARVNHDSINPYINDKTPKGILKKTYWHLCYQGSR